MLQFLKDCLTFNEIHQYHSMALIVSGHLNQRSCCGLVDKSQALKHVVPGSNLPVAAAAAACSDLG